MSTNEISARAGAIAGAARTLGGVQQDLAAIASAVASAADSADWEGAAAARLSALVSAWSAELRAVGGQIGGTVGALGAWQRDLAATEQAHGQAIAGVGAKVDGSAPRPGVQDDDLPDTRLLVDRMRGLSAMLAATTGRIEDELEALDRRVDRLRGEWTGQAQRAYDSAQSEWTADLGRMRDILGEIAAMTDELASGYVATDAAAARRFE